MAVADTERVVVHLDLGQSVVKKVWRFDPRRLQDYTRSKVEQELIDLFPDVSCQNLKLSLWYEDDLAGEVSLHSCVYARKTVCGFRWLLRIIQTWKPHLRF